MTAAARLLAALHERGLTVGTAESLTGGLVVAALTDVPGASASVVGSVVSYATRVKRDVLGVDADLLAARGAVDPEVAAAMASGVCRVLGCDVGLATTGVAGPDPQDGQPVGTVYVAVRVPGGSAVNTSGDLVFRGPGDAMVEGSGDLVFRGPGDVTVEGSGDSVRVERLSLSGDRAAIRAATVSAVLDLAHAVLTG